MLAEEAQHLSRRIGAVWVREGAGGAAAGPGVGCAVNQPMLRDDPVLRIVILGPRVSVPPWHLPLHYLWTLIGRARGQVRH
jgi:hypothetical protein